MNQYKFFGLFLAFVLFTSASLVSAGTYYKTTQRGNITSVDKKQKTIVVNSERYKLKHAARIHDIEQTFPSISTLRTGMTIDFNTRKNKRTGLVEISEIWVIYF